MNKKLALKTFRFLTAFILGALSMTAVFAYVFTATTISYRSSLFPGRTVSVRNGKVITTLVHYNAR